jgi:hypothetical protein
VAGPPARVQAQPVDPLLGRLDQVEAQVVADRVRVATDLADRLRTPVEQVAVLLDEEPGAVRAPGLLVGGERQHDVARGHHPVAAPPAHDRQHHRVEVLHVDGAPAPQVAVAQLAGERVHRPLRRVGRHHVEVPVHQQRLAGRVGSGDPGDHIRAARGRLQDRRLDAHLGQSGRDVLGGHPLPGAGGRVTGVGGVDAQQVAAQLDDFPLAAREAHRVFIPVAGFAAHAVGARAPHHLR